MAAPYIVTNSRFRPFSYQELLAPVQAYTDKYNEVENQYGELGTLASVWKNRLNRDVDKTAYSLYENFINDLQSQADLLYNEGLNADSTRNLVSMKSRYTSDITPIEEAYKQRAEKINEQNEGKTKDPTRRYGMDASLMSVDDFLNRTVSIDSYSGKELEDTVSRMATNLARDIKDNPYKYQSILNGQYFNMITDPKVTANDILNQLYNEDNPLLQTILNQAVDSIGIQNWNVSDRRKLELFEDAYNAGSRGLWSAIGETKNHILGNKDYDNGNNNNTDNGNLPYRNVQRAQVWVDKKRETITNVESQVAEILKDPVAILTQKDVPVFTDKELKEPVNGAHAGIGIDPLVVSRMQGYNPNGFDKIGFNNNLKQLGLEPIDFNNISEEEFTNKIQELQQVIEERKSKLDIIKNIPIANVTKQGKIDIANSLKESVMTHSAGNQKQSGVMALDKNGNKKKKNLTVGEVANILDNAGEYITIEFDFEGMVLRYFDVDKNGKPDYSELRAMLVPYELFHSYLPNIANNIAMNVEGGDINKISYAFEQLFAIIENQATTKVQGQSGTSSK